MAGAMKSKKIILTPREVEVLRLICGGAKTCEVAEHLGISMRTMEQHIQHIHAKVGLRQGMSRYAVAVIAERAGLLKGVIPA